MRSFKPAVSFSGVVAVLLCGVALGQPGDFGAPIPAPFDAPQPSLPPGAEFEAAPADAPPMIGEGGAQARAKECFQVQLADSSVLVGKFADDAKITINAKIGKITLPLTDVALIGQAFEENQFHVVLDNRDRITGEVDFGKLALKTSWGEVPLTAKSLRSLEAGKLVEQTVMQSRPSPDGRTVVSVRRVYQEFQSSVAGTNSPYPSATAPTTYYSTPQAVYPQPTYQAPAPSTPLQPVRVN